MEPCIDCGKTADRSLWIRYEGPDVPPAEEPICSDCAEHYSHENSEDNPI